MLARDLLSNYLIESSVATFFSVLMSASLWSISYNLMDTFLCLIVHLLVSGKISGWMASSL